MCLRDDMGGVDWIGLAQEEQVESSGECSNKPLKNPWPESASELYRPSDHRLSATLVPTFCG
jgi:hypothetical protein